jgi:5'-AMP-activated protein kinase catalytic alpha subunit
MISGKEYTPLKADIWSSGVILYAMLWGFLPFEDPNTTELYRKILSWDYELPIFLSIDATDLLRKTLNIDPVKRFSVAQIRKHHWCKANNQRILSGIIVGYEQIPIDTNVLHELEEYEIDPAKAVKCLEANNHNHITTTYYLLLKKFVLEGGYSNADVSREDFSPRIVTRGPMPSKRLNMSLPNAVHPPLPKFPVEDNIYSQRRRRVIENRNFSVGRASSSRDYALPKRKINKGAT